MANKSPKVIYKSAKVTSAVKAVSVNGPGMSSDQKRVIAIASIILFAVLIFGAFLFFGQKFVGKAIAFDIDKVGVNKIGIPVSGSAEIDEVIILPVYANLGTKKSYAFSVKVEYSPPDFVEFQDLVVPAGIVILDTKTGPGFVKLVGASLGEGENAPPALTGNINLFSLSFKVVDEGVVTLSVSEVEMYDEQGAKISLDGLSTEFETKGKPITEGVDEYGASYKYGDLNLDGNVNVADLNCMINLVLAELSNKAAPACLKVDKDKADFNCDGKVTVADQTALVTRVNTKKFPSGIDVDSNNVPDCKEKLPTQEICTNTIDDDGDKLTDCEDMDCMGNDDCHDFYCDCNDECAIVNGKWTCVDCATDEYCGAGSKCVNYKCVQTSLECPSAGWENVCCTFTPEQFMNFINAFNKKEVTYTPEQFMNFINAFNKQEALCVKS